MHFSEKKLCILIKIIKYSKPIQEITEGFGIKMMPEFDVDVNLFRRHFTFISRLLGISEIRARERGGCEMNNTC